MCSSMDKFYAEMAQADKLLHIQYSAVIFVFLSVICSLPIALVLTFFIGLLKEVWDKYYGSGFCFYDMAANLLGMAFVYPGIVMVKSFF